MARRLTSRRPRATIAPRKIAKEIFPMFMTKHDGQTFTNSTIYISGQAFINCTFSGCTLVLREALYHMEGCTFERCNWHIDRVLMWGNMDGIRELKSLTTMVEQALETHLKNQPPQEEKPA